MRTIFINTLAKIAAQDERVMLLTGDLGFKIFDELREQLGDRFINAGVAESNMVSVAAGLAMAGKRPYCYSMVPFLTMRAFEHIRVDICSHNLPVRLVGIGAGLGYAMEGVTHHALEDIAIMRALPNMSVVAPGDKHETESIIEATKDFDGPLFIRLAKDMSETAHKAPPALHLGSSLTIQEGEDIALLVCGPLLPSCTILCKELRARGNDVRLISMPSVKPLDVATLREVASTARAIFTIEEHSIVGGFGGAVAEHLLETGYHGVFKRIGLPDTFFETVGGLECLRADAGIDKNSMMETILDTLETIPKTQPKLRAIQGS